MCIKMGTFLLLVISKVPSDSITRELLKSVFGIFGNKKLTRLDSDHMWLSLYIFQHWRPIFDLPAFCLPRYYYYSHRCRRRHPIDPFLPITLSMIPGTTLCLTHMRTLETNWVLEVSRQPCIVCSGHYLGFGVSSSSTSKCTSNWLILLSRVLCKYAACKNKQYVMYIHTVNDLGNLHIT